MPAAYVDKDEMAAELLKSQRQGSPTVRICEIFNEMIERFMHSPKYNRYTWALKQDLATACLVKCLKSIKNFKAVKPDGTKGNPFSYYTRCIETTIWTELKEVKKQRQIIDDLKQRQRDMLAGMIFDGSVGEIQGDSI